MCAYLYICIFVNVSLPAAPTISSRASSLMVSGEWSEDTWTHPSSYLYPTSQQTQQAPTHIHTHTHFLFSVDLIHVLTLLHTTTHIISYRAPIFVFAHFCPVVAHPLCLCQGLQYLTPVYDSLMGHSLLASHNIQAVKTVIQSPFTCGTYICCGVALLLAALE